MDKKPNNPDELGALWIKTAKTGSVFMSGKIGDLEVVIFRNDTPVKTDNPFPAGTPDEDAPF